MVFVIECPGINTEPKRGYFRVRKHYLQLLWGNSHQLALTLFLSDLSEFMDLWSTGISGLQNSIFAQPCLPPPFPDRGYPVLCPPLQGAHDEEGPWGQSLCNYLEYPHVFHVCLKEVSWTVWKNHCEGAVREPCYINTRKKDIYNQVGSKSSL